MSYTRVKICGLQRPEDVDYVNEVRPDFAGFIFDPSRRRYIEPKAAVSLRFRLADTIRAVGVFVNADPDHILAVSKLVQLDAIQLHGNENENFICQLKERTLLTIIKAIRVETKEDIHKAESSPADLIILDNGRGGTGTIFNWALASDLSRNFLLAGGISPENAADAIRICHPWGLDASSSLETNGYKDQTKIRTFMQSVRTADRKERKEKNTNRSQI